MVQKEIIKNALKAMSLELQSMTDYEQSVDKWADLLAAIIKDAILSAEVQPGQTVTTTGTAAAQTGATTTPGTLQ